MIVSENMWRDYIDRLRNINDHAANLMADYIRTHPLDIEENLYSAMEYGYALATKYGEAAASLACMMYEAIAEASGVTVPAAVPAATATFGEVAQQINGTLKQSQNPDKIASSIARLVKVTGVDTTMQNALRDGAEWAWIPVGDTCPFCLMLASRGWNKASKKAIKKGHAEHVHANCDCTYAVRFNKSTDVAGYDPQSYYDYYKSFGSDLNAMRRENYKVNKDKINEQKRIAYRARQENKVD